MFRFRALIGNPLEVYIGSINQYQIFIWFATPAIAQLFHYQYKSTIFNWLISPGKNKAGTICCGSFVCFKIKDILRETQISRFYRYAKKTQISLDPKKYRYVGDICTFEMMLHLQSVKQKRTLRDEKIAMQRIRLQDLLNFESDFYAAI